LKEEDGRTTLEVKKIDQKEKSARRKRRRRRRRRRRRCFSFLQPKKESSGE